MKFRLVPVGWSSPEGDRGRTADHDPITAAMAWLLCAALACGATVVGVSAEPAKRPAPAIQFVDVTDGAGIEFIHRHGGNGMKYYIETVPPGNCWLDYDGDG